MRPHDTMSPHDTRTVPAARPAAAFDPLTALDDLLSTVSLARAATGGAVSIAGQDPTVPAAHQLGACIGIPVMAAAVAGVAFHRHRGGPGQDLDPDLRQAVHGSNLRRTPRAHFRVLVAGRDRDSPRCRARGGLARGRQSFVEPFDTPRQHM
jgi:hypothetical protein